MGIERSIYETAFAPLFGTNKMSFGWSTYVGLPLPAMICFRFTAISVGLEELRQ
jgi:hypothetical protein